MLAYAVEQFFELVIVYSSDFAILSMKIRFFMIASRFCFITFDLDSGIDGSEDDIGDDTGRIDAMAEIVVDAIGTVNTVAGDVTGVFSDDVHMHHCPRYGCHRRHG